MKTKAQKRVTALRNLYRHLARANLSDYSKDRITREISALCGRLNGAQVAEAQS